MLTMNMKLLSKHSFLFLPLLLHISKCAASLQGFSVHNDLLAFPQYEVIFSEALIRPEEAERLLSNGSSQREEHGEQEEDGEDMMDLGLEYHAGEKNAGADIYEKMTFQDRSFLCTIPYVPPQKAGPDNNTLSKEEQAKELVRATDRGWELLKSMKGSCIYYAAGWWVYSFCYDDGIKQFHPVPQGTPGVPFFPPTEDPNTHSYVLGKFEEQGMAREIDAPATQEITSQLQTRGETNYLVQRLGGGTICDLTGRERRIEVQFHCNPSSFDKISLIKETASCVYLMVIHTPKLCNDVAFLPPQSERPHIISCQEIVSHEELSQWTRRKIEDAEREIFADHVADEAKKPLIIGGIEVGAQKLVGGSPERSIKVPHNIGTHGQRETLIGTIASSDGKYIKIMSDREIKNLGLNVPQADIDKSIREMEDFSKGKPWELNVIKTAEGLKIEGLARDDEVEREDASSKNRGEKQGKPAREWKGKKPGKAGKKSVKTEPQDDEESEAYEEERGSEEEYR